MDMNKYRLRPLDVKDAPRMLEWLHDEEATKYLRLNGKEATIADTMLFVQNSQSETVNLHRAIVDDQDFYMGTVSLKNIDCVKREAEYAITMHPSAWGSGAAYNATEQILEIAFNELELKKVYLNVLEENERAIKFYEKTGFQYTGTTVTDFRGIEKLLRWYERRN